MSELQKYSGRKNKKEALYLQKNSDIEALIKKATLGIITENSLVNFREGKNITEKRNQLKRRKLNTKEKMILDCIADKFMKKEDCYYLRKSDEWKNKNYLLDEFPFLLQDSIFSSKTGKLEEGMSSIGIGVILTTREIKKKTGLNIPHWKISEMVWGLFDKAYFISEERILYRDGKFEKYTSPCLDRYLQIQSKAVGHI